MKTYCVSCKKNTENKNSKVFKTKKIKGLVLNSICSVCGNEKFRFVSENEGSGLLSSLGIKTPLSKIPLLNLVF